MEKKAEIYLWVVAWLKGEITTAETEKLEAWLAEDPKNRAWFDAFTQQESLQEALQLYQSFHTEERWKAFERQSMPIRSRRMLSRYWAYAAAVVVIGLVAGISYWHFNTVVPGNTPMAVVDQREMYNRAVLITESGTEVVLSGMKDTCLCLNQGEHLFIREQGKLSYQLDSSATKKAEEWHVLRIPRGGEYKLVLADGTQVWLNSVSELRYPVRFTGNERQVELQGEAYFQVARDEAKPFTVRAGGQRVKVLGTSFDVTAYPEERQIYTTLLQGSIEVRGENTRRLLKPGDQAIYTERGIEVRKVNAALYCSWIQDRFVFMSEPLERVARKLERWYDAEFLFVGQGLKEKRFTGSIPKYSNLTKVLNMLELTTNIRFRAEGRTVVVEMIP